MRRQPAERGVSVTYGGWAPGDLHPLQGVNMTSVNSEWYDVLEAVRAAREQLGDPATVWYRGHSNGHWSLIPGLHRWPDGLAKEQALFGEFQRSAARLVTKRDDDWETLFDMQHYGVPTRLLDWTEALGVAMARHIRRKHLGK